LARASSRLVDESWLDGASRFADASRPARTSRFAGESWPTDDSRFAYAWAPVRTMGSSRYTRSLKTRDCVYRSSLSI
jgi:hypothetical protein